MLSSNQEAFIRTNQYLDEAEQAKVLELTIQMNKEENERGPNDRKHSIKNIPLVPPPIVYSPPPPRPIIPSTSPNQQFQDMIYSGSYSEREVEELMVLEAIRLSLIADNADSGSERYYQSTCATVCTSNMDETSNIDVELRSESSILSREELNQEDFLHEEMDLTNAYPFEDKARLNQSHSRHSSSSSTSNSDLLISNISVDNNNNVQINFEENEEKQETQVEEPSDNANQVVEVEEQSDNEVAVVPDVDQQQLQQQEVKDIIECPVVAVEFKQVVFFFHLNFTRLLSSRSRVFPIFAVLLGLEFHDSW
eukprot:gene2518-2877_t